MYAIKMLNGAVVGRMSLVTAYHKMKNTSNVVAVVRMW
jgi:hypothetical protein